MKLKRIWCLIGFLVLYRECIIYSSNGKIIVWLSYLLETVINLLGVFIILLGLED